MKFALGAPVFSRQEVWIIKFSAILLKELPRYLQLVDNNISYAMTASYFQIGKITPLKSLN